ncbi:MAG: tRNA (adenosine(37)-N6)-dimethylallyltransferase MiaA [Clostridia bacterium]|nr:tRNA (adenosine(37)-N6)-dimethylallyltransferase MiaA [Clostridia bacterium]
MSRAFYPYPIIAGPTASGKTALAVQLAKRLGGEVVSADSMQIYAGVSVGTARPTVQEMEGVVHHLQGFLPLQEKYSVARYIEDATAVFAAVFARNSQPILCGGTGLYIQSFMENRQLFEQPADPSLRQELVAFAEKNGQEALMERLRQVDPASAARLHLNDRNRIIRALEVFYTTGRTIGEQDRLSHSCPSPYTPCLFLLDFQDRQHLYDRIDRRVDCMLENGLLEEAQRILRTDREATVTQAIGYKEFDAYFSGEISLEAAAACLKQQTRRYAKRQLSWFHRMDGAYTLWMDGGDDLHTLTEKAARHFDEFCERRGNL